jgi:Membrane protein TerC, possibly involved in tellurium resistance
MIAGASWGWWIGFHVAVIALLVADWMLPGRRRESKHTQFFAWVGTGTMITAALAFAGWVAYAHGPQAALEYIAGYTVETSLSIDNLFVFMVLFDGFHVNTHGQHKALLWGVGGAVLLRGVFIALGVTLLDDFSWITYVFGAFLLYAAYRLLFGDDTKSAVPGWIRNLRPKAGSLLPVILAVEFTDVIFATDSIPAVLAVTKNPFVAYTSNIAAVLGLRSLYFALAGLLDRIKYLHYGLGALLAFIAIKMMLIHWFEIPIVASLIVIAVILAVCAIASALFPGEKAGDKSSEEKSKTTK